MADFATTRLPEKPAHTALDRTEVRQLLDLGGGGVADITLPIVKGSQSLVRNTVAEKCFLLGDRRELWRSHDGLRESRGRGGWRLNDRSSRHELLVAAGRRRAIDHGRRRDAAMDG